METPAFVLHHQFYVIWLKQTQKYERKDYA